MPTPNPNLLNFPLLLSTLLLLLATTLSLSLASSQIPLGSKISVSNGNSWASSNGNFAVSFLKRSSSDQQPNQYTLGIRFDSNSISSDNHATVWVAGADIVVGNASYFHLTQDGELVLFDWGASVWTSGTKGLSVSSASLLNNGNLVLLNSLNHPVWQSFHTPSDTLLPGQNLSAPNILRPPKGGSRSSLYSLYMISSGQLQLKFEYNVTFWTSGPPLGRNLSAVLDSVGSFQLLDGKGTPVWSVFASDYDDAAVRFRFLRLDSDGNLRMYSWVGDSDSGSWVQVWQAVQNQCHVFATCGFKGVCAYNSSGYPVCKCPFRSSAADCSAPYGHGCDSKTSLVTYEHTVLYGIYPPNDSYVVTNLDECKELCLQDPFCTAVSYSNDGAAAKCKIQTSRYITGYADPALVSVSFAKICSDPFAVFPTNSEPAASFSSNSAITRVEKAHGLTIVCVVGASLSSFFVVVMAQFVVGFWVCKKRKSRRTRRNSASAAAHLGLVSAGLIDLTYTEIQEITGNFMYPIGPDLFKGTLLDSHLVVVKKLDASIDEKKLRTTMAVIGSISHKNLLKLEGYCFEKGYKFLVYEFLKNGSLEKWLLDPKLGKRLTWRKRMGICLSVARAISYLHSQCREFIAHGNLSCENVVLDDNLDAKVTGFSTNRMAPAFVEEGRCSSSFGVGLAEEDLKQFGQIVLYLISGRPSVENFCEQCYEKWLEGDVRCLVDGRLEGDKVELEELDRALRLGFWCLQYNARLRPSMGEVVKVLEGTLTIDSPPCPFELQRYGDGGGTLELDLEN